MRIGVIGADGFIGSEIANILSKYHSVIYITKKNYESYKGSVLDILINANGSSKKYWAETHKIEDFILNTESVYRSSKDFTFRKYIYISTVDVDSDTTYGFHKRLAEMILTRECTDLLILRCGTVIGKNMKKGFIYDLMNNLKLYVSRCSSFYLITNTAIAEFITTCLERDMKGVYNVAGVDNITPEIAAVILRVNAQYHEEAQFQHYTINVNETLDVYPLKTSAQYLLDILK